MRWIKTVTWMVVFFAVILFSIQNREEVTLHFGLFPIEKTASFELQRIPLFLPILCALFLGVLASSTSDAIKRFQMRRVLRQKQKMIERLEEEIQTLRSR